MIQVSQIKLLPQHTDEEMELAILQVLKIKKEELVSWSIKRRSIDARKKPNIYYVYTFLVELKREEALLERLNRKKKHPQVDKFKMNPYNIPLSGEKKLKHPPIIVGSGPAGLFCAYELAKNGFKPILLERGAPVEQRLIDVEKFWETGILNPESNVQFGEGGAGTFSDGKLNTGVKDPLGRNTEVLSILVEHGAPEHILYEAKPHIGTDILLNVVKNMRKQILKWGGEIHFYSKVTALDMKEIDGQTRVCGVCINESKRLESEVVVLALGHSARDTFTYLAEQKVPMEAKSFAVGLRVEHSQHLINESQYGVNYDRNLEPSPYKLTANTQQNRGVYSFCMCPGGYVVNASSQENTTVVNGMSYSKRDGTNANSAIVVTVGPKDFGTSHVLDGMKFQMKIEEAAYHIGQGKVPVQLLEDFYNNQASTNLGTIQPQIKGEYLLSNVRAALPEYLSEAIAEGMQSFGRKIRGFDAKDVVLSGVETRTSSPIRILRNGQCESDIKGLYPCGEGAGYAGGITSAAMDGLKVFESIIGCYSSTK